MDRIFIGSEQLASGALTRHELRAHHSWVFPDVYGPRFGTLTLEERTWAAWLWSKRAGVVAGLTAAAALGAKWIDDDVPVELIWPNHRAPKGILTRNDLLLDGESIDLGHLRVTTAERTAFDLARRGPVGQAVERLDALARATSFATEDVMAMTASHPNSRGVRRIGQVLDLVDAGAESPQETWLRLLLIEAGFPRPETQLPVLAPSGYPRYRLDMGWPELMIAVEYDGETHADTWRDDIVRSEYIAHVGWIHIRVVAGHRRPDIVARVRRAWATRGGRLPSTLR